MPEDQEMVQAETPGSRLPGGLRVPAKLQSIWATFAGSLNFYRVHVLYFSIVSGIISRIVQLKC